jgi:hypothetical protein
VGVGSDRHIDRAALHRLAQAANCTAVTLDDFTRLEEMLLCIAYRVSTRLAGVRYSLGNVSWDGLREIRSLSTVPLDWMVLLDRSGSMFNQG